MRGQSLIRQVYVFFRHGSNLAMAAALIVAGTLLVSRFDLRGLLPYLVVGLFLFPAYEYAVHRWLLHARPIGAEWCYRLQCRIHYDHHREPDRIELLFTPLFMFVPLIMGHGLFFLAVTRSVPVSLALVTGSLLGYMHYEWVHYVAHLPGIPRTPWGRWLKTYHRWHHYKNEHFWFGVTSPVVDMLMGTCRPVEAVNKSPTTRQLYEAPRRS